MKASSERPFTTISGVPIAPCYGPEDVECLEIGLPGSFSYTRGIPPGMYRDKLWTMRQFFGFATPEETNRRYHLSVGAKGKPVFRSHSTSRR